MAKQVHGTKVQVKAFGNTYNGYLKVGVYADQGQRAVEIIRDDGEPLTTLTVNLEQSVGLEDNQVFIKDWSENEEIVDQIYDLGLFEDTRERVPTGFVVAPLWELAPGVEWGGGV